MTRPEGSCAAPDGPQRSEGRGGPAILFRDAKTPLWRRRKIVGRSPLRRKRGLQPFTRWPDQAIEQAVWAVARPVAAHFCDQRHQRLGTAADSLGTLILCLPVVATIPTGTGRRLTDLRHRRSTALGPAVDRNKLGDPTGRISVATASSVGYPGLIAWPIRKRWPRRLCLAGWPASCPKPGRSDVVVWIRQRGPALTRRSFAEATH
jgi:hypothetical protein